MNITLEKKVKNSSKNHVYIVQNLTELKALKLSKKNLSYFSEKLKAKSLAHINDAGTYTFIVPFSTLNKKNPKMQWQLSLQNTKCLHMRETSNQKQ